MSDHCKDGTISVLRRNGQQKERIMTQHEMSNGTAIAKVLVALLAALTVALTMAVATSQTADAAGTKPGVIRRAVDLTPAAAAAEIRQKTAEGLQEFGVDMETIDDATGKSVVPEGTSFRVFITNSAHPGKSFMVGRVVIDQSGHGLLALSNDRAAIDIGEALPLEPGVKPVTKIKTVVVKDSAGQVVLKGSF